METSLPIYGLACPDVKHASEEFNTQKDCSCMKQAPQRLVSGIIKNGSTDKPFEVGLVNVYNTHTKKGTTTTTDGSFSLYAASNDRITISFVGYQTMEVQASELPTTIKLQEKTELIPEVIITATKKAKNKYVYTSMGLLGLLFVYAIAKDKNKKKTSS